MEMRRIKTNLTTLITLGAMYVGTAIAFNALLTGLRVPFELAQRKLFNETKKEYTATLKGIGHLKLLQTKGILMCGDFKLENGSEIRIYDSARVLEGKLFENTRMPSKEGISKKYKLKTIGSNKIGYTLLEAKLEE